MTIQTFIKLLRATSDRKVFDTTLDISQALTLIDRHLGCDRLANILESLPAAEDPKGLEP